MLTFLSAILTNRNSGNDQSIAVEKSCGFSGEISAKILKQKILLRLLLVGAFRCHGWDFTYYQA